MSDKYRCDKVGCGYTTSRGYSFATHLRTHLEEKPFVCDSCSAGFADNSNLKKHQIRCKGGTFPCKQCGLTFSSASLVTRHLQQSKLQLPFKCDHCCGSFKAKRNLTTHIMTRHPKQVPNSTTAETSTATPCVDGTSPTDEDDLDVYPQTQMPSKVTASSTPMTIYSRKRPTLPISPNAIELQKKQRCIDPIGDEGQELPLAPETVEAATSTTITNEDQDLFPQFTQLSAAEREMNENVAVICQSQHDDMQNEEDGYESEGEEEVASENVSKMNQENDANAEPGPINNQTLMLSLWKMTNIRPSDHDELSPNEKVAVELLCGERTKISPLDMATILMNGLHDHIGIFATGTILLYYMKELKLNDLVLFYNSSRQYEEIKEIHRVFIQHYVAFTLQEKIFDIIIDTVFFRNISADLISMLCFEDLNNDIKTQGSKADAAVQLQKKVLQILQDMIAVTVFHNDKDKPTLLDESFTMAERLTFWHLLWNFVRENLELGCMSFLPEVVLLTARLVHDKTKPYLNVLTEDCSILLHLHPTSVAKFGVAEIENVDKIETVLSTIENVQDFTKYVYCNSKMRIQKGCVSMGIFKLAVAVGIRNTWDFLFDPTTNLSDVVTRANVEDVLKIAIILKREADIQLAWNLVKSSLSSRTCALNGLQPRDIECFFDCNVVEDEMDKYEMLLAWSYDKASIPLPAKDMIHFNIAVAAEFAGVKSLLKVKLLAKHFNIIVRQRYLTFGEMFAQDL